MGGSLIKGSAREAKTDMAARVESPFPPGFRGFRNNLRCANKKVLCSVNCTGPVRPIRRLVTH